MSEAANKFFAWSKVYINMMIIPAEVYDRLTVEKAFTKLRVTLPGVLRELAKEAESNGIDSTPCIVAACEASAGGPFNEDLLDAAHAIATRLRFISEIKGAKANDETRPPLATVHDEDSKGSEPEAPTDDHPDFNAAIACLTAPQKAFVGYLHNHKYAVGADDLSQFVDSDSDRPSEAVRALVRRINTTWTKKKIRFQIKSEGRNPVKYSLKASRTQEST